MSTFAVASLNVGFGADGLFSFDEIAIIANVGGITSVLQGGKFGHGFISAGIGAAVGGSRLLRGAKFGEQIAVRSVVGGTLSEITGGKFANGAVTAAFAAAVSEGANANKPNFSEMTKVAWVQENADRLGLDFSNVDSINLGNIDDHVAHVFPDGGIVACNGPCAGSEVDADFNIKTGEIRLFAGAFEGGMSKIFRDIQVSQGYVSGANELTVITRLWNDSFTPLVTSWRILKA